MRRKENPSFDWNQMDDIDFFLPSPEDGNYFYRWAEIPEELEERWRPPGKYKFELVGKFLDLGCIEETDLMTIAALMHKAKYSLPHRYNYSIDSEDFPIRNLPVKKVLSKERFIPYNIILPLKSINLPQDRFEKDMAKIIMETNKDLEFIGKPTLPPYIS
jgi:hypothetical protein